jgi:DNA (cytosine-5)-methyltransferase 1
MIKVGSDFSGVGAFDQSLIKLGIEYKTIFACDMDKYARQTFIHNYGEPEYYPTNVYDRKIPSESLDIYMTSPPCQAFSLAGKRLGKDDKRGILFFNSHEFIQVNKPRYFIFENVKGLLSDDGGKTFQEWVNMLGGKSVNGVPVLFPYDESVPYHLYWKVLNAKHHGVPQNRERVFLIGIRDGVDNNFQFPKEEHLIKRLKDVLEDNVDDKYFLSENTIEKLIDYDIKQKENGNGFGAKFHDINGNMSALKVGGGGCDDLIKIKSATVKGYEEAKEGDSINFSVPNSETRRGRVGKGVAQTLDTACNQGVMVGDYRSDEGFRWRQDGNSPAIMAMMRDTWKEKFTGQNPPIIHKDYKIRRLTPRECFRLMDFPDTFTWPVSDSQAYKQAGNSIVVNVLYKIIKNLSL